MARRFEKISFEQFKKDITDNEELYDSYDTPKRTTRNSAGYDFLAIEPFTLEPGEIKKIPTGLKATMEEDEVLFLIVRSSMGFKYNVRLCNQVGVIDGDYYNNPSNEGHMWVALQNHGEKTYSVAKGECYTQGVFSKFLKVDNEEVTTQDRIGGLGSTTKN